MSDQERKSTCPLTEEQADKILKALASVQEHQIKVERYLFGFRVIVAFTASLLFAFSFVVENWATLKSFIHKLLEIK